MTTQLTTTLGDLIEGSGKRFRVHLLNGIVEDGALTGVELQGCQPSHVRLKTADGRRLRIALAEVRAWQELSSR